jgi:dephospho-CoA kinase
MQGDPYQVAITYCDGQVFIHDYLEAADAIKDYAGALEEAFVPSESEVDRRHIREVVFAKYDEKQVLVRHIDSGVMNDDCSHRVTTTKGTQ